MHISRKKLLTLVAGLAVVLSSLYYQSHLQAIVKYDRSIKPAWGVPIKVAEVIDGDTIVLANGDRLRYIGMDTPEEFDQRKPVQCFAKEAADKNKALVEGHTITFYKDQTTKDQYGRWLGFVYLEDGTFVNYQLVHDGYAFAYPFPPDISKSALFHDAETQAREAKLGLWAGECQISKLSTGREQTNPVQ